MPIGRVLKCLGAHGTAEFTSGVRTNDFIYYKASNNKRVLCQISGLNSLPNGGIQGTFMILESAVEPPKIWAYLYILQQKIEGHLSIGVNDKEEPVNFRVNPFFRHVLIAGKTFTGKTHVEIAIQEEFLKIHVPSIIIDTQGEFVNLNKFSPNAIVVEDLRIEDMIAHLQQRKTVIYNLQGLSYPAKTERCFEVLSGLRDAKEKDYKQAENDIRLLEIPPVIVDIDETEIYAPEQTVSGTKNRNCREIVIDIAKRGGKFGIGSIVSSQRLPGLHYDVRSQCNSALIFHITDSGSRTVLAQYPYITAYDLKRIRDLHRGQCIVTGDIVPHPILLNVRSIATARTKSLDFEGMLGLTSVEIAEIEEEETEAEFVFEEKLKQGITFQLLQSKYPAREIPIHGFCIVVSEHNFKPDWKSTLEAQGCKVIYCPNMPGGSVYLIRRNHENETLQKIKETANKHLPKDAGGIPYH